HARGPAARSPGWRCADVMASPAAAGHHRTVLLINRNYARLWYGQAVSLIGDYVFDTTLVLWVGTVLLRGNRYAPAAVAGVLLAVAAATMLVSPLAGVFVDRWDNRRTMLVADVVRAGLVGLLAAVAFLPA